MVSRERRGVKGRWGPVWRLVSLYRCMMRHDYDRDAVGVVGYKFFHDGNTQFQSVPRNVDETPSK